MAIPYGIKVIIQDVSGDIATTEFFVQEAMTKAQYDEAAETLVEVLDDVIGGKINAAVLGIPVSLAALINNAVGSVSDVGDVGAFQYRTAENRPVKVNIPGLDETLVAAGSDDIDTAAAAVAAFNTAMLNGIAVTGGTITPCNIGENDITTLVYARERFRNRGLRS